MNSKSLLDYISRYITLSSDEEAFLLSKIKKKIYLKNQYIIQQGDICKTLNFVVSGCTKTFYLGEEGGEHIMMFSVENWWVSDLGSFISQLPADYNVLCIENTELIQIQYKDLEELYAEIPKLNLFFRKILEQALVASQKRIIRNFSLSAKERYIIFKELYPEIYKRVPQYMIASYLGITKEFLSKIKKQLLLDK